MRDIVMDLIATPAMGRRRFVVTGLAATGTLILSGALGAQAAALVPTPPQTAGPFYPMKFPPDVDNDLVVLRGSEARAEGTVTHVMGRVLGLEGKPIPSATVEIWQCDAKGRYLHPGDTGGRPATRQFKATAARFRARTAPTVSAPSSRYPIRGALRTSTSPCKRPAGASSSPRCIWRASR